MLIRVFCYPNDRISFNLHVWKGKYGLLFNNLIWSDPVDIPCRYRYRTLDAVIDQNPKVQAREVVKLLASAVKGTTEPDYPPRLQVVFRENIPEMQASASRPGNPDQ